MRPVETPGSRDFKILKDGDPPVSRGLTPRPATGAHEGARLQAQHCKPILPRDGCPSTVSLSWAPPQLNQSCISSLSDSDRLENNFDLVELGGPRLRAPGLGRKKPAPRSVKRVVGASQQILLLHLSASAKEAPDRHVRCRGGVLAVQSPLCTHAAEARVCLGGVPARNDM